MTEGIPIGIFLFMLAAFVGFEIISKVPTLLHTPLMSGTNAISGLVLLAAILVLGTSTEYQGTVLGFAAVVLGAINVFGGFALTDRMLQMFQKKGDRR